MVNRESGSYEFCGGILVDDQVSFYCRNLYFFFFFINGFIYDVDFVFIYFNLLNDCV